MHDAPMTSDLMTSTVAAGRLGVSVRTIARMVATGRLTPACKLDGIRGGYLFTSADVNECAAHLRGTP